jgi:hypothetical protein
MLKSAEPGTDLLICARKLRQERRLGWKILRTQLGKSVAR